MQAFNDNLAARALADPRVLPEEELILAVSHWRTAAETRPSTQVDDELEILEREMSRRFGGTTTVRANFEEPKKSLRGRWWRKLMALKSA